LNAKAKLNLSALKGEDSKATLKDYNPYVFDVGCGLSLSTV